MTTNPDRTPAKWALPFGVTLIAMFALQLSNLGFSPLLPSIQQEFGMNYKQLGLFTGMYGLLALALSVPAGLSAKRFGEKRVLGVGLLGVAAGSLLLGQAWDFESALAFRGLTIFGYRFAFVSVLIAVALTAPPSLRGVVDLVRLDVGRLFFAAREALLNYRWPGNIRELRNVVERASIICPQEKVEISHLGMAEQPANNAPRVGAALSLDELEKAHIGAVLATAGTLDQAAKTLGIDASTLYRKRKQYNL